jgi:hypothetical protein
MRANEFVTEDNVGKLGKRRQAATRGLNKFRDEHYADRVYELNRVMMAVASNDGTDFVNEIDGESWSGRNNVAAPYTEVEQRMLDKAYKAVGSKHWDLNKGDMNSEEVTSTNTKSPVVSFKGYPR